MKSPVLIVSAVVILIAGIVMCWLNGRVDILHTTVLIIGAAFAVGGLINLIGITVSRRHRRVNALMSLVSWVSGIGGIILGGYLLFFPGSVTGYVAYLFGIILLAGGLTLVCLMSFSEKGIRFPGYFFILPVLIIIDGVVVLCTDSVKNIPDRLVIFTAVGFILFGVSAIMNLTSGSVQRRRNEKAALIAEENADVVKPSAVSEPSGEKEPVSSSEKPVEENKGQE